MNNLGLVALNTLAVRFLLPLVAVEVAVLAQRPGWGLSREFAGFAEDAGRARSIKQRTFHPSLSEGRGVER